MLCSSRRGAMTRDKGRSEEPTSRPSVRQLSMVFLPVAQKAKNPAESTTWDRCSHSLRACREGARWPHRLYLNIFASAALRPEAKKKCFTRADVDRLEMSFHRLFKDLYMRKRHFYDRCAEVDHSSLSRKIRLNTTWRKLIGIHVALDRDDRYDTA